MNTEGKHVIADLWFETIPDTGDLILTIYAALKVSGMTVLGHVEHCFEPQGFTVLFLLAESHFSMHTFPEHGYLSLDCYTCGEEGDAAAAVEHFIKRTQPTSQLIRTVERGGAPPEWNRAS